MYKKVLYNIKKIKKMCGGRGRGGCERRIEVFCGRGWVGWGGESGWVGSGWM